AAETAADDHDVVWRGIAGKGHRRDLPRSAGYDPRVDAGVIGSGHNGLVAAAYLARAGLDVELLERNGVAGGTVASEELTQPGFVHDTFSAWHPLFVLSATFAELGAELAARGLEYANTPEETTANVRADGRTVIAY